MPNQLLDKICFLAAQGQREELLKLKQVGIPLQITTVEGETPALVCLARNQIQAVRLLLELQSEPCAQMTLLFQVIWQKKVYELIHWGLRQPTMIATVIAEMPSEQDAIIDLLSDLDDLTLRTDVQTRLKQAYPQSINVLDRLNVVAEEIGEFKRRFHLSLDQAKLCVKHRDTLVAVREAMPLGLDAYLQAMNALKANPSCSYLLLNPAYQNYIFAEVCELGNVPIADQMIQDFQLSTEAVTVDFLTRAFLQGKDEFVAWCLKINPELANQFQNTSGDIEIINRYKKLILPVQLENLKSNLAGNGAGESSKRKNTGEVRTSRKTKESGRQSPSVSKQLKTLVNDYRVNAKYLNLPALPNLGGVTLVPPEQKPDETWLQFTAKKPEKTAGKLVIHSFTLSESQNSFYKLKYYTQETQPVQANDRMTVVFAKRGMDGYYPSETAGGRVILILSEEEGENTKLLGNLIGPNRDICVIEALNMMARIDGQDVLDTIPKKELGLIMSRRLAGFYLASHFKRKHVMFLDDNLVQYDIKPSMTMSSLTGWADVYNYFAIQAANSQMICISPRSWRPELTSKLKDASETETVDVSATIGAKVFYMDWEKLSQGFPDLATISTLLTHHRRSWGSDIFFQLMILLKNNQGVGVIDFNSMMVLRASDVKNSALKTINPATEWLSMSEAQFIEGDQQRVCITMKAIVQMNLDRYHAEAQRYTTLDLKKVQAEKEKQTYTAEALRSEPLDGHNWEMSSDELTRLSQSNLRPYQREAVSKLNENIGKIGRLQGPPRIGKTMMIWDFVARLFADITRCRGHIVLITPQLQLVQQLYDDIEKYQAISGNQTFSKRHVIKVGSGETNISHILLNLNTRVGSDPTIFIFCANSFNLMMEVNPKFLDHVAVSLVDEVHKIHARTQKALTDHARKNGRTAFCISATPGAIARNFYPTEIYRMTLAQACQLKVLAPWKVDGLGVDFSKDNVRQFIDELPHFLRTRYHPNGRLYIDNQKIVVFVPSVNAAKNARDYLKAQSIPAVAIYSHGVSPKIREKWLNEFETGDTNILFAVKMVRFGKTFKRCDVVIYLQHCKIQPKYLERHADDLLQGVARCLGRSDNDDQKIASIVLFNDANANALNYLPEEGQVELALDVKYLGQEKALSPTSIFKIDGFVWKNEVTAPLGQQRIAELLADTSSEEDDEELEEGEIVDQDDNRNADTASRSFKKAKSLTQKSATSRLPPVDDDIVPQAHNLDEDALKPPKKRNRWTLFANNSNQRSTTSQPQPVDDDNDAYYASMANASTSRLNQ